ncbi:hypothetical protein N7481_010897 [Penicillium waksmanii]|uniref:uncharacterized protein n=1 Tax=Penicillium waksmanii TaxID=69791 RepID=UPI002547A6D7|nr:uncharacterized protein N7481_010897 [Penicillium waksmanii]KAJ5973687.1 hypothetical protein N7481_010897 [Penicillium waksmanii]
MPRVFEQRLKEMEERQADRLNSNAIQEGKSRTNIQKGLSWNVIQRLENLDAIKKHNEENGHEHSQLQNIKAITKEYKSGRLDLTGLVTVIPRDSGLRV